MKLQILKPKVAAAPNRVQMLPSSGTQRIRGSALMKIRERILKRDRWLCHCRLCQEANRVRVADDVEHRIPLWAHGPEDDLNRYAIASECHAAKTACEARMRAAGGWLSTPCTCGHHVGEQPTGKESTS